MPVRLLGRPRRMTDPLLRVEVSQHIEVLGPSAGLPTLRAMFPEVARSELQDVQAACRRRWHADHLVGTEELCWTMPGTVWAADFTQPPVPIDDCYDNLLAIRDLASHKNLEGLPVLRADSRLAVDVIASLFCIYGPPLVLKADNGSQFVAESFRELLADHGVVILLSPPRLPRYNGSVEAGNGSLKTRIFHEAARHGRGSGWTSDDVEAAREQLNHTLRPWGPSGPTPEELWRSRTPITPPQRSEFIQCVRDMRQAFLAEQGLEGEILAANARAAVARAAIRRALVALGYLWVQRKRISPPFNSPLRDKFR